MTICSHFQSSFAVVVKIEEAQVVAARLLRELIYEYEYYKE